NPAVRNFGLHSLALRGVRRLLELDELLPFLHEIALVEVEPLDLADHMRADVDLEARIDLARCGDDGFDLLHLRRLRVNVLPFRSVAANAEDDDQDERGGDGNAGDDAPIQSFPAFICANAGPISFSAVMQIHIVRT